MDLLEKAKALADNAHRGQLDRFGEPFINHPLRVMKMGRNKTEKIVGVLHDVVEKTGVTFAELQAAGFPAPVIMALVCLTHDNQKETYEEYINRLSVNSLAVAVKLHGLSDNMDLRRYLALEEGDFKRLKKYHKAFTFLKSLSRTKPDGFAEVRKIHRNAFKRWTVEENDTLERLFCEGNAVPDIAVQLGRTALSIEVRILDLQVPDKYGIEFTPSQRALKYHLERLKKSREL